MTTFKEYYESFILDVLSNPIISASLTALVGGSIVALNKLQSYLKSNERGQKFVRDLLELTRMVQRNNPTAQAFAQSIVNAYSDIFSRERLERQVKTILAGDEGESVPSSM